MKTRLLVAALVVAASCSISTSAMAQDTRPWITRNAPDPWMWELGFGWGLWLPDSELAMLSGDLAKPARPGPFEAKGPGTGFFVRLGVYPLEVAGLELEAGAADVANDAGDSVNFQFGRANLLIQLPFFSIVPFAIGGLGSVSDKGDADVVGTDSSFEWHVGGGLKVNIWRYFQVRAEARQLFADKAGGGMVGSWEFHVFGVALTLGHDDPPQPAPVDTDGDGIVGAADRCPGEAETVNGVLDDDGCPEKDTDGDGLMDHEDRCPAEPGPRPDGCPAAPPAPVDSDGDGLDDDVDKCPTEPETPNGFEDADGCPDELPSQVKAFTGVIEGIQFASGKDTIKGSSKATLEKVAEVLRAYPTLRLRISGYSDDQGPKDFNVDLSARRAAAVKAWLVDKGIEADRIETAGHGPANPIADNATQKGRARNRRIEFEILR